MAPSTHDGPTRASGRRSGAGGAEDGAAALARVEASIATLTGMAGANLVLTLAIRANVLP